MLSAATGPAADKLPADPSKASAELFESETIQLTDESLASLEGSLEGLELFDFENGKLLRRDAVEDDSEHLDCKVFPGDAAWPSDATWDLFDILIDGGLRKPAPLASACYQDAWGPVDKEECDRVTAGWQTSKLQYVAFPFSLFFLLWKPIWGSPIRKAGCRTWLTCSTQL